MKRCNCKLTWEYQEYLDRRDRLDDAGRLLMAIFDPFDREMYEERCDECIEFEREMTEKAEMMDEVVRNSGLPETTFNWVDPVATDFRDLYEAFFQTRLKAMQQSAETGEMVPISAVRNIVMWWANIGDEETFERYIEIGMWVDEALRTANMDYDELDAHNRNQQEIAIDSDLADEIASDAFDFIRKRFTDAMNERRIIAQMEEEFNED